MMSILYLHVQCPALGLDLLWSNKLLLASDHADGGEGLSWERNLPRLRVRIRVDQAEHTGSSLSETHHIKHHHMSQKFTNSRTRCTKWATRVLATAATSWISTPETKSHPLRLV